MKKSFLLFFAVLLLSGLVYAQVKTPDVPQGNTPNLTDANGNKYGLWSEKVNELNWKGEYIANKKVKTWVGYFSNNFIGKLENYSNGWKDGILIQFDRKGKVTLIENYKNDKLDGQVFYYGSSVETPLSESEYSDGKKNGLFRQYYDNGKIQEETWFKDDKKNGQSKWNNKAGQRIALYNYNLGNFDGIQKTFYENDSIQTINNYSNNIQTGESKEFYRNGRMKLSGNYLNGIKEGSWTEYDELGKVQRVVKYKNGQEVKK
jgi:antitoxin component YwqK of YwqJK toxin-antitoxin module